MALRIQNSLTKKKEDFVPLRTGEVKIYACGPTVYDEPHLGHLRSAYIFDIIRNFLEYSGFKVTFVRNVTDVDDKIIQKALESDQGDLQAESRIVSERYLKLYHEELRFFGIRKPDMEPMATSHITEMIALIERLMAKGFAYASGGDVYFDVKLFQAYGKLSHQNKDAMLEGTRFEVSANKKDALDFALWKKAKEGEPFWLSPWGNGRPGWHIECSAMSMKYLGETFDIHGGGRDLIFPHHENEIAQSEASTGKNFANYWVHHGLVTKDGHKMSKSLKNFITCRELRERPDVNRDALKLFFLGTHYSMPLDYSEEKMKMEHSVWKRFYYFFDETRQIEKKYAPKKTAELEGYESEFLGAMNDDFNTSQAIATMHEMMHYARKSNDGAVMISVAKKIKSMGGSIFGLFTGLSANDDLADLADYDKLEAEIRPLIEARKEARAKKDFKSADAIRSRLLTEKQIELIDLAGADTIWRRKV